MTETRLTSSHRISLTAPNVESESLVASVPRTNLNLVLKHLQELGYAVAAHKLRASDYGLPQRRTRYYIVGVRRDSEIFAGSMEDVLSSVAERLQWLKCESSPPVP